MFQSLGMLDSLWSLIILYTAVNLPIAVWLMRDFTAQVPLELEESAIIDGAGRLRIFLRIVLPVVRPGLAATFLFVAVLAWNEYIFGLILSTADTQTMPLLVAAQNATRGPQWWTMSALIIVMIGPVFALALLLERYLRSGALVGAVKG
jgi:multiple sugar transport system permease protein